MNKNDLAISLSREMYKQSGGLNRFNAYKCLCSYFEDLSIEDLIAISSQYGIKAD